MSKYNRAGYQAVRGIRLGIMLLACALVPATAGRCFGDTRASCTRDSDFEVSRRGEPLQGGPRMGLRKTRLVSLADRMVAQAVNEATQSGCPTEGSGGDYGDWRIACLATRGGSCAECVRPTEAGKICLDEALKQAGCTDPTRNTKCANAINRVGCATACCP